MSSRVNVRLYVTHGLKWEMSQKWLRIPIVARQAVQNVTMTDIPDVVADDVK